MAEKEREMANSKVVLVIEVPLDGNTVASAMAKAVGASPYTEGAGAWESIRNIANFIETQLQGGIMISYADTAVSASTTGTFTGATTAGQTITINGVAFTARASNPAANEFVLSSNVTTQAANLAAAINASTTEGIINTVRATSALGVVTFYSVVPGPVGKNIALSEGLDNFTLADTTLSTGGTQAHNATYQAGVNVPTAS